MQKNPCAGSGVPYTLIADAQNMTIDVARAQRLLLLGLFGILACNVSAHLLLVSTPSIIVVWLAVAAINIAAVYRLNKVLELAPAVWSILMLIPIINLISGMLLVRKATAYLRENATRASLFARR